MIRNQQQFQQVETKLSALLREKTGYDIADLDRDASFLELGFDSLFLIQFSMELQKPSTNRRRFHRWAFA
jgi:acyl carrier protein